MEDFIASYTRRERLFQFLALLPVIVIVSAIFRKNHVFSTPMKLPYDAQLLQYPIGPFEPKPSLTAEEKKEAIDTIGTLPSRLYEITAEITTEQLRWCYRPEGWSIRELIHHLADSHMNAFLRLKWTLFEDNTSIKGYDEAAWTSSADVTQAPIVSSLQLLDGLHERWTHLLNSLSEEQWTLSYYHPEQGRRVPLTEYVQSYAWHCNHHHRHILLALDHEGKYKKT